MPGRSFALLLDLDEIAYLFVSAFIQYGGRRGMTMAARMYAKIPLPPRAQNSTQARRTTVGSMPKYYAIPPQTPPIILFSLDL